MQSQKASPPARRRNRIPLSCEPCRARKLKCNRETPCQNCAARNESAACKFRGNKGGDAAIAGPQKKTVMSQRLEHLENLVKGLISDRKDTTSVKKPVAHTPESPQSMPAAFTSDVHSTVRTGDSLVDDNHSVYVGGEDWYTVLQEIKELRKTCDQESVDHDDLELRPIDTHLVDGSSLLFNQVKPLERIEIISTLPPKTEVDQLISQFFNRRDFPITVPPIIHEPTFMQEYEKHWKDTSQTGFIWLGLLFSILGIAMLAYHQYGEPPKYEGISEFLFQLYRIRTAQCLLSGDIAKCLPYTLETLRFNATAELNRRDDNRRGLWIMTGVIMRVAVNMGYHRDPSMSSGISVFQAEYRRRLWVSVVSMDDMASFNGGFPRMMSAIYSDTKEPRNIHDWELSEDTTELPKSRDLNEVTSVTYLISKGRLLRALGRVTDLNTAPSSNSYEKVLEIDDDLSRTYENFPTHMKLPSNTNGSVAAWATAHHSSMRLLLMYHKGMCILHRRFLAKAKVNSRYKTSWDRCRSSALIILDSQEGLKPELYEFAQTRQMLTLAAMVLILELELERDSSDKGPIRGSYDLIRALERSCSFWAEAKAICDEACKIYHALARMISNLHPGTGPGTLSSRMVASDSSPDCTEPSPWLFSESDRLMNITNMDFDWNDWDAFMEDTPENNGHIY
ncbi:hypothetical protein F5Y15DRAFT_171018 [Xylariaceae sp. FL0016]|nr:hypothetical protein F5Y15DRAFT_171018 [Xylariaceae sp. FL0016]